MKHFAHTLTATVILALAGCVSVAPGGPAAVADLAPTTGNQTSGTVTFAQRGDKVVVVAKVSGLTPGQHGFHLHEKGDCGSGDGMSAGGHFNPFTKPHGSPLAPDHHAGDLPMLAAAGNGNATLEIELGLMTIGSGAGDIVGRAVIVHKDPDDFTTQPTGNSGARVACGVIRRS
ncbi:MAG: superoxide dismutase family protein [Betaproteobacteria bacterium]